MPSSCPLGFDHSLDTHRSKNDRTVKKRPYGQKTTVQSKNDRVLRSIHRALAYLDQRLIAVL